MGVQRGLAWGGGVVVEPTTAAAAGAMTRGGGKPEEVGRTKDPVEIPPACASTLMDSGCGQEATTVPSIVCSSGQQ